MTVAPVGNRRITELLVQVVRTKMLLIVGGETMVRSRRTRMQIIADRVAARKVLLVGDANKVMAKNPFN
ncbi:hypothetical protein HanIR_Chr17g0882171 [Helianthus annuus]|nr:hypothetical protein HanIR_Chr17g0882171 [Helianthus annuus]